MASLTPARKRAGKPLWEKHWGKVKPSPAMLSAVQQVYELPEPDRTQVLARFYFDGSEKRARQHAEEEYAERVEREEFEAWQLAQLSEEERRAQVRAEEAAEAEREKEWEAMIEELDRKDQEFAAWKAAGKPKAE